MSLRSQMLWPVDLSALPGRDARPRDDEIAALQTARGAGVPIARIETVPADIEERFYRLNNLPDRLMTLFADVDPSDPDEDDLEEHAPAAMDIIASHFLLDEFIDAFYHRISTLPARLRVRRPGEAGIECARGRPALLGIKELWAADWSFDALVERLERTGTFALEARPVLVHGRDVSASPELQARIEAAVGAGFESWVTPAGDVTRLMHAGTG